MNRRPRIIGLFNEQGGLCAYCAKPMKLVCERQPMQATIEHVRPKCVARGQHYNTVAACRRCNESKGNTPLIVWLLKR